MHLHQLPLSHYNEKVRWALDVKQAPHRRVPYRPGWHIPLLRWLSGQTQVPVMEVDGALILGSADIIDWIERTWPEPALYPSDPQAREQALAHQRWADEAIGPHLRRALYWEILPDTAYMAASFSYGLGAPLRTVYRVQFPVFRWFMRRYMNIYDAPAERSREHLARALDELVERLDGRPYLVEDRFTIADLAVVAMLGPVTDLAGYVDWVQPRSPTAQTWFSRWEGHPAIPWLQRVWTEHRRQVS